VWLEEFICPAYQPVDCEDSDWTVTLERQSPLYSTSVERSSLPPLSAVDFFTLDGSFQKHELLEDDGHCLMAYDRKNRVFYIVDKIHSVVRILAPEVGHCCRMPLARVLRELATMHCLNVGHLHCHAAAFAFGNQAIMLAGGKRSGKTSALIHSLSQPATQFITNDRLFVKHEYDRLLVRGMPTILKVRTESLEMLPAFGRRFRGYPYRYQFGLNESKRRVSVWRKRMFGTTDVVARVSNAQFCDLMNVSAIGQANLASVVFPRVTADVNRVLIERLPPEVAASRLFNECLLAASSPQRTAEAFLREDDRSVLSDQAVQRQCERIAYQVPCYDCALGPASYQLPSLFDGLLRRAA